MKKDLFVTILAISLVALAFAGWIMNITAIIHSSGLTGMVIARIIGVFMFPIGAVLGYF